MSTATPSTIPGYIAATWDVDPLHTEVRFSIRHAMISKLRGRFTRFEGELVTGTDPLQSSVTASIDLASVATGNEDRDNRIRSADFLDVANHPVMSWRSTSVGEAGHQYIVDGELSLHGVTRNVPLKIDVNDFVESPMGTRVRFSASAELSRAAFGMTFNLPMESVVIGDRVTVNLEVEALLRTA
jgi:polyisoprenoid-binding protein YceI